MKHAVAIALFTVACGDSGDSQPSDAQPAPDAAIDAAVATDYLTIPMSTPDGTLWGPTVTIGSQAFLVDIDTGSTTIGVAGAACAQCTGVSPLYAASTTATDEHLTSSTEYADGSRWSGEVYSDSVTIKTGATSIPLKFVDITSQHEFFYGNEYQGIFGMGDALNAEDNTDAFMSTAVAANAFKNSMAFELCGMNEGGGTGTMWLGGFDAAKASAAPVYTPLLAITPNQPFYAIDISSMTIGDTTVGTGASSFQKPVVDTGTTYFYLPTAIFNATTSAIKASTGYTALFGTQQLSEDNCVTASGVTASMVDTMLPPLTITMPGMAGGAPVTVSASAMRSYIYDGGNGMFCYGLGDGGTQDATTMGDSIMRNFVTVIDLANSQVGWAPDTGCALTPAAQRTHTGKLAHPRPPKRKKR